MDEEMRTPMRPRHSTQSRSTEQEVAGIIAKLLLHFWAPSDMSDGARKSMAQDWLEDLVEFGPAIAAEACREWRRQPGARRPRPGDIRALCLTAQAAQRERLAYAVPAESDSYARSVGWASEAERRAAIAREAADRAEREERARLVREEALATGGIQRGNAYAAATEALRANGVTVREDEPHSMAAE